MQLLCLLNCTWVHKEIAERAQNHHLAKNQSMDLSLFCLTLTSSSLGMLNVTVVMCKWFSKEVDDAEGFYELLLFFGACTQYTKFIQISPGSQPIT